MNLNANQRYAIIGSSGSGKSNLTYLLLTEIRNRRQPIVVIDHKGEYLDLPDVSKVDPSAITGGNLAARLRASNASVVIDMRRLKDPDKWVNDFVLSCLKLPRKVPILIVIEEAHNYAPQRGASASKRSVNRLAAEGRAQGYGCLLISQRCSKLDKDSLAESEFIFLLRHNWGKDIEYLADLIGQERAAQVNHLQTGEILLMDYPNNKFYPPEMVPLAERKKRGGTPKAVSVDPNLNALTQEYTKPYTYVTAQAEETTLSYGMIGLGILFVIVSLAIIIFYYYNKKPEAARDPIVNQDSGGYYAG